MIDQNARRMRQVIRTLIASHTYFGSLALRLPIVADPQRENIGTDGRNLFYNPEWVAQNTADQISARIAGCVLGCCLKHHTRRGERNYKRWQKAHHMVTGPMLKDAGLSDSEGFLGSADCSIEQAYDMLPEEDDQPTPDPQGQPDGGSGSGSGEMMDSPVEDAGETKAEEQQWDQAGQQAMAMAKAEGKVPGKIKELLEAAHGGRIEWREELRRFMLDTAKADYSWTRPNRRYIASGLYLPVMHSEAMPPFILAIDTSGSMDTESLAQCWGEIRAAAAEVDPEQVTVIQCSTKVHSIDHYHPAQMPPELEAMGRGGTKFSPVFAAARDLPPAACLIYHTDGYCKDFGDDPGCPVLWAIEPKGKSDFEPPFGETIYLGDD